MKCYFCKIECTVSYENLEICPNHKNHIYHYKDSVQYNLYLTNVLWFYSRRRYLINFFHETNHLHMCNNLTESKTRFRVDEIDEGIVVFDLPFLPNINPENFDEKIPLWLTIL